RIELLPDRPALRAGPRAARRGWLRLYPAVLGFRPRSFRCADRPGGFCRAAGRRALDRDRNPADLRAAAGVTACWGCRRRPNRRLSGRDPFAASAGTSAAKLRAGVAAVLQPVSKERCRTD